MTQLNSEIIKLLEARERHDKARIEEEETKRQKKAQEALVHELLQDAGIKSHTIDLGPPHGEVRLVPQSRVSGTIFDEEIALEAFEAEGLTDELVKPGPRKAVLNELVRERLENGQALPAGVSFYTTDFVTVTRKKQT